MTARVELEIRQPPLVMGWWTTVGGGSGVVNDESDSTYLRAYQPPWQEDWHWSTWFGSGGIHEFQAAIPPGTALDDPVLRVRISARARIQQGTYFNPAHMRGRLFWQSRLGDAVRWSGKSVYTTFPGQPDYEWHDIVSPWQTKDPRGRPWTYRSLRKSRWLMGRTATYGQMWISRMRFEIEVPVPAPPSDPEMVLTGPSGTVTHTSRPDVTWLPSGDYTQAGWEIEVHEGQRNTRRTETLVAASGIQPDTRNRWTIDTSLMPSGLYTAFGRVAREWGGTLLWSRWARITWEMGLAPPDPPSVNRRRRPDELAIELSWPGLQSAGFGLGPFGLTPFGGGAAQIELESADSRDGPWTERHLADVGDDKWTDRFAPFNEPRWYRGRAVAVYDEDPVASEPSPPVSATLEVPANTAAITCTRTGRTVRVRLRGRQLTPTIRNRMQTMAAADLDTTVVQGQPSTMGYVGQFIVPADGFDELFAMLRNPAVLVWRDAYRFRFPFVWTSDMSVDPLVGRADTPHTIEFAMTVVPWPERLH